MLKINELGSGAKPRKFFIILIISNKEDCYLSL